MLFEKKFKQENFTWLEVLPQKTQTQGDAPTIAHTNSLALYSNHKEKRIIH